VKNFEIFFMIFLRTQIIFSKKIRIKKPYLKLYKSIFFKKIDVEKFYSFFEI
jgi:hypothetical protein